MHQRVSRNSVQIQWRLRSNCCRNARLKWSRVNRRRRARESRWGSLCKYHGLKRPWTLSLSIWQSSRKLPCSASNSPCWPTNRKRRQATMSTSRRSWDRFVINLHSRSNRKSWQYLLHQLVSCRNAKLLNQSTTSLRQSWRLSRMGSSGLRLTAKVEMMRKLLLHFLSSPKAIKSSWNKIRMKLTTLNISRSRSERARRSW